MERSSYGFRTYHSMPGSYGGLLSAEEIPSGILEYIFRTLLYGRDIALNLKCPPGMQIPLRENGRIRQIKTEWSSAHLLTLDDRYERSYGKYDRNTKRAIKKAHQYQVTVRLSHEPEHYKRFYELYQMRQQEWEDPVVEPKRLYDTLMKYAGEDVQLWIAELEGRMIGGFIFLLFGDTAFAWMNASPNEYRNYYPIFSITDEVIRHACEQGIHHINFGASGNLEGVRRFKESFGAEVVPTDSYWITSTLGYYLMNYRNPLKAFMP
jgi:lipid II:glycine glycyltransferase (peptidoglycan interpeptide bridge formation enzyme)